MSIPGSMNNKWKGFATRTAHAKNINIMSPIVAILIRKYNQG